jgi:hypothetical protein
MISDVSASVIVAYLGIPIRDGDSAEERVTLVNALSMVCKNGVAIRIAHAQCNARVDHLGGRNPVHVWRCRTRFQQHLEATTR